MATKINAPMICYIHQSLALGIVRDRLTAGRSLFLSECHAFPMMTKNANTLGGTVKSWASSSFVSPVPYLHYRHQLTAFKA